MELDSSRPSSYFLFHLRWRSRVQLLVVRGPPAYAYVDPLSFQPIGVHGPPPQLKIGVGWKRVTFFYQFLPSFFYDVASFFSAFFLIIQWNLVMDGIVVVFL